MKLRCFLTGHTWLTYYSEAENNKRSPRGILDFAYRVCLVCGRKEVSVPSSSFHFLKTVRTYQEIGGDIKEIKPGQIIKL